MSLVRQIFKIAALCFFVVIEQVFGDNEEELFLVEASTNYPRDFIFASGTSSYQVEGAWNVSGKGESIWDRLLHTNPSFAVDKSTGDVACDSYHHYEKDTKLLKQIGFTAYRFSISWPRILPNGIKNNVNKEGLLHYRKLIDDLLENGIQPFVTMYHWDLPQYLQDLGGWLNDDIVDRFVDYAEILFTNYGDKVKWWVTLNEPLSIANGYGGTDYAPALNQSAVSEYKAAHNMLKAHAKVYRLHKRKFNHQRSKVSISLHASYCYPKDPSNEDDIRAAERFMDFEYGWFAHPIFSIYGDYPPVMRYLIDNHSAQEDRKISRLPYFTSKEIEFIRGTYDFFALNHYTSALCTTGSIGPKSSWIWDMEVITSRLNSWSFANNTWLYVSIVTSCVEEDKVVPDGFRQVLNRIKDVYGNPEIFVTENGFSENAIYADEERINYLRAYMTEMLRAINEDQVKVKGYSVWSLLDNFEWESGYSERYGLLYVNMSDPDRKRTMKASAIFMKNYIGANSIKD